MSFTLLPEHYEMGAWMFALLVYVQLTHDPSFTLGYLFFCAFVFSAIGESQVVGGVTYALHHSTIGLIFGVFAHSSTYAALSLIRMFWPKTRAPGEGSKHALSKG